MATAGFDSWSFCVSLLLGMLLASAGQGQVLCPGSPRDYLIGPTKMYLNTGNVRNSRDLTACQTDMCRAQFALDCHFDALDRAGTPNTMGFLTPELANREYYRNVARIRRFARRYNRLFPIMCDMLKPVAPLLNGEDHDDLEVAIDLLDTAVRLDRPGHDCSGPVAAGLHDTAKVREIVSYAQDACRPEVAKQCRRIKLPWQTAVSPSRSRS